MACMDSVQHDYPVVCGLGPIKPTGNTSTSIPRPVSNVSPSIPNPKELNQDDSRPDQHLDEWLTFLTRYANGQFSHLHTIPAPPLPDPTPESESADYPPSPAYLFSFDNPVYTTTEITPEIARKVQNHYKHHRFLPPPRAPLESVRENIIREYDLYSAKQTENIQSAVDLIQSFFGGITTFTLFKNDQQEFMAVAGPPEVIGTIGVKTHERVLPETSLCAHSILADGIIFIPDLKADWRTNANPYTGPGVGFKSYMASVVSLQMDPASLTDDKEISVGVINSLHRDDYLPPLRDDQIKVIQHVTRMLQTQLRATWEGTTRTKEAKARRAVSDLLESSMEPLGGGWVGEKEVETPSAELFRADPMLAEAEKRVQDADREHPESLELLAQLAVSQMANVLEESDTVGVLDLRPLRVIRKSDGIHTYAPVSELTEDFPFLAWKTDSHPDDKPLKQGPAALDIVLDYLHGFQHRREYTFDQSNKLQSGFEPYLPRSGQAHLVFPFLSADNPLFAILVSTSRYYSTFRASDINFVRSMGVILRSRILQSRVIEADAAKTAFLSSISHELRTPLHGVVSGIQLIKEAMENDDLETMEKMVSMTESSSSTLGEILNDTLDFGQLAQGNNIGSKERKKNLEQVTMATAEMCMPRIKADDEVQLVVEIEKRDWMVMVDEVAYQRILLNGLTNAIKFTSSGRITLKLTSTPDNENITIQIRDTGKGVDPVFASKVFEPFTKANSFSPGAGLGLFITKALADRMGGSIALTSPEGGGALFEVKLPLAFDADRPTADGVEMAEHVLEAPRSTMGSSVSTRRSSRTHSHSRAESRLSSVSRQSSAPIGQFPLGPAPPIASLDNLKIDNRIVPPTSKDLGDVIEDGDEADIKEDHSGDEDDSDSEDKHLIRILIADDNDIGLKILLTLLQRIAKDQRILTITARDGVEAVEQYTKFKPHLVLTDVSMPRLDGISAAAEMRKLDKLWGVESRKRCKIFAITGLGSSDPRLKMDALRGEAGLDGWLIKGQDKLERIRGIVDEVRKAQEGGDEWE